VAENGGGLPSGGMMPNRQFRTSHHVVFVSLLGRYLSFNSSNHAKQ